MSTPRYALKTRNGSYMVFPTGTSRAAIGYAPDQRVRPERRVRLVRVRVTEIKPCARHTAKSKGSP